MGEKPAHERLCPAIAISYDEYVTALNTGQYHYSDREANFRRIDGAKMHLDIVKRSTEECEGPVVIEEDGEIKLHCPAKDRTWNLEQVRSFYQGYEGERPSLFFAIQMLEEATSVPSE